MSTHTPMAAFHTSACAGKTFRGHARANKINASSSSPRYVRSLVPGGSEPPRRGVRLVPRISAPERVSGMAEDEGDENNSVVKSFDMQEGTLYVGVSTNCTPDWPGNGGLRVRTYDNASDAENEAKALCDSMTLKHAAYNTGFTGAKLVFDSKVEVSDLNKEGLMNEVARTLASEAGRVYTGCDINTTDSDMAYLDQISPYVLAGIGSTVDTNKATADGTYAAVVRTAEMLKLPKDFKVFIQGSGKVGAFLAKSLVEYGATVYTSDIAAERADIKGCTNVSNMEDWADLEMDIFSPCATAGVVTDEVANRLKCKAIVGAANVPFHTRTARDTTQKRGIAFVPEYITSAGAIIVDSMEWRHEDWASLRPSVAYAFCYDMVYAKVGEFLEACDEAKSDPNVSSDWDDVTLSVCEPRESTPVGSKLRNWIDAATENTDVLVIGAGMAGTAAAYQISKLGEGLKGVVLEAGEEPANRKGSSYGESRMFRQMYSDEYFSNLQSESLELWNELEQESGSKLLDVNGLLFYGEADTGETVEGSIPGALEVMEKRKLPHKFFDDSTALKDTFDRFAPGEEHIGLFEETAGSVNSGLACKEMMRMAQETGAWDLRCNSRVLDVWQEPGSEKYHVLTSSGKIYNTDKIVCAAGAWTNDILQHLDVQLDVEVWRVHWGHFKTKSEETGPPQWFHFGKEDALFYGFPAKDGLAKVGVDFSPEHDRFKSMEGFNYEADESLSNQIDSFLREQWGDMYGEKVDMVASPYTMTKDSMFILDTVPNHPNVSVFSAGNGRAFKFGPMLGRALANLVLGQEPAFDISPMAMTRPGILKAKAVPATEDKTDAFGRAHVPFGETGSTLYSKLTLGCFDVVMNTKDLLLDSVKALGLPEDSAGMIRMADFGAADGGPEMPMIHEIKKALPAKCQLEVCFEDQPNNDFTSLFYLANGIEKLPVDSPSLTSDPDIFFTACGRSFFEQCLPNESVDVVTSFTACHWLSQLPANLLDSVHHTLSKDTNTLAAFSNQAAKDWETFLSARSAEMKKGAQGVIATLAKDPEGRYLGWNGDNQMANMYGELNKIWDNMLKEGSITAEEHQEATFCNYYRTEEELKAAFEGEKLGLKLVALEWRSITCPFGRGKGEAADVVGTVRTWSNSTFLSALGSNRSDQEKQALVDSLYEQYRLVISANPEQHAMDYMHGYLRFEKC